VKRSDRQAIFTLNTSKLILWADAQEYALTYGEAFRTPEMAAIYAAKGIGIKDSQHCKRLAVDFNLFINGIYRTDSESYGRLGMAWEALHPDNRWGGRFKDGNHFEMQGG
jgi:hypothetical protein